jgi:hypothetical protein
LGKTGTIGAYMKAATKKDQKINLVNCERVSSFDANCNNSSQIRCSVPIKVSYPEKKPQIISIHQAETVVRIKETKGTG